MLPAEHERLVLVTAPDEAVAGRLARGLVEAGLAACVNRVPGVRSTYVWKGEVEEAGEVLLLVKTDREALEGLAAYLAEHHPYETPECVTLAPAEVERAYLAWWREGLPRT
jgi:periplasmic divalent cation tolerance protein